MCRKVKWLPNSATDSQSARANTQGINVYKLGTIHMTAQTQNVPFVSSHSSDERNMAALAHAGALLNLFGGVCGLIAALVIWLTQKEKSAWVAFHALQSLVFQAFLMIITILVVGVVWVVGFLISFATVGIGTFVAVPIMILFFFGGFAMIAAGMAYSFYGAYQVYQGREFRYLWVGDWLEHRSGRN
jgi:uncharacterized protein